MRSRYTTYYQNSQRPIQNLYYKTLNSTIDEDFGHQPIRKFYSVSYRPPSRQYSKYFDNSFRAITPNNSYRNTIEISNQNNSSKIFQDLNRIQKKRLVRKFINEQMKQFEDKKIPRTPDHFTRPRRFKIENHQPNALQLSFNAYQQTQNSLEAHKQYSLRFPPQKSYSLYKPKIKTKPQRIKQYTIKKTPSRNKVNNIFNFEIPPEPEIQQPYQISIQSMPYYYFQPTQSIRINNANNNILTIRSPVGYTQVTNSLINPESKISQQAIFENAKKLTYYIKKNSSNLIAAYVGKTSNGIEKNYNEDKIKIIIDVNLNTQIRNYPINNLNSLKISYFAIFDGHGGEKCSEFLRQNLQTYIFRSNFFPTEPVKAIKEAFEDCEKDFRNFAYQNSQLIEESGSCAIIALFINKTCYVINLGDSRALYSCYSGRHLYQVTRDHKPEDNVERQRITRNGGSVYIDNLVEYGGIRYDLRKVNFGEGVQLPCRIFPGNLAVSIFLIF